MFCLMWLKCEYWWRSGDTNLLHSDLPWQSDSLYSCVLYCKGSNYVETHVPGKITSKCTSIFSSDISNYLSPSNAHSMLLCNSMWSMQLCHSNWPLPGLMISKVHVGKCNDLVYNFSSRLALTYSPNLFST